MSTPKTDHAAIEKIAREILGLETLETRRSDSLDFHEHAVWTIREALEAAFNAGREAGATKARAIKTYRVPDGKGGTTKVTIPED